MREREEGWESSAVSDSGELEASCEGMEETACWLLVWLAERAEA